MNFTIRALAYTALLTLPASQGASAAENLPAPSGERIELGIPKSLFQYVPPALQKIAADPFMKLLKDQTGVAGKLHVFADAMTLAHQMNEDKAQMGIFQGYEFAWAQAEYPDLVPLAIATPREPLQSFCLVRWDCKAKNIGDLKGEKISMLSKPHQFCELFLKHEKEEHMKGTSFGPTVDEQSAVDAIFDVIDQKTACTIVDRATLKYFETTYPGKFKNLKILCKSQVFPNPCIAVKKNKIDPKTIDKLRDTLVNTQNQSEGEALLTLWKLKSFDKVPANYEEELKSIQKTYPAPTVTRAVER